jgi:hypothetical protein
VNGGNWTWLEVAKLSVAAATPVIVLIAGFFLNRRLKKVEQAQWSMQKVVERRIAAYDEIATTANQLYCYFSYVGGWKELTPPEAIKLKRKLDQVVYINVPLFEPKFKVLYEELIAAFFTTFGKWGTDAKLRTHTGRREESFGSEWDSDWAKYFVAHDEAMNPKFVQNPYGRFMAYLGEAVGVPKVDEHLLGSTQTPSDFEVRAAGIVSTTPIPLDDPG